MVNLESSVTDVNPMVVQSLVFDPVEKIGTTTFRPIQTPLP